MGNKDGAARVASLTVVRSDIFFSTHNGDASIKIYVDILSQTYDKIAANKKKYPTSKAVINMPFGIRKTQDAKYESGYATAMKVMLQAVEALDVLVAAVPGNDGTEIQTCPCLLKKKNKAGEVPVPDLIIVGSFDKSDSDYANDTWDPEIGIYGPSDEKSDGGIIAHPGLEYASWDGAGYHMGERGTLIPSRLRNLASLSPLVR